ncbi:MAG TPA: hypothetical protein VKE69_12200 [Planctomycetota bacterium]|nr:hypothetical protein [Planctomycetota bacterium]
MSRVRRKLALALLAPLGFLAAVEGIAWAAGVRTPRYVGLEPVADYWVRYDEPGEPAGYTRAFPRNYKLYPEQLPLFVRDKPANGWRLFALGESSVQGLPWEVGCFSDRLRVRLAAMLPDRSIEVVNAGNAGWHAAEIRTLLRECLEHAPDALVWMVGHNESVPQNVLALRDEVESPFLSRLSRAALSLRTAELIRRIAPKPTKSARTVVFDRLVASEEPCLGPEFPLLQRRYREAVAGAVADARAAGVPILLCTMPRNAHDYAPSGSWFTPAVRDDPERRRKWTEAYDRGCGLLSAGKAQDALARFEEALAIDDAPAKLHFQLGRAHEALKEGAAARSAYVRALEQEACPMRARAWVEEAIRQVALETGAPLVDLERMFDSRGKLALAGSELIADNCHPNLEGHALIADALLDELERDVHLPLDRGRDLSTRETEDRLGVTAYRELHSTKDQALFDVRAVLQSGVPGELASRVRASCEKVLARDATDWEVMGALGLVDAIDGDRESAHRRITEAMKQNGFVRISYLLYAKLEPPWRSAFDRAGIDMAAVEANLSDDERMSLTNRLAKVGR